MPDSVYVGWFGPTQGSSSWSAGPVFPNIAVTGQFIGPAADNTAAPPFTFAGDLTTGIASPAPGVVAVRTSGASLVTFSGAMSGASETSNFVNVNGTLPSAPGTTVNAVMVEITSAGSAPTFSRAMNILLRPGYTGTVKTVGLGVENTALGVGTGAFFGSANIGIETGAGVNGSGAKVGIRSNVVRSSVMNAAGVFTTTTAVNAPQHQVGVAAFSLNGSSTNIAGYFGLQAAEPTLGFSAALVANNGATTHPIAVFQDNSVTVASVKDGGTIDAVAYQVGGVAGANGAGAVISSITVVNGLVTAITVV